MNGKMSDNYREYAITMCQIEHLKARTLQDMPSVVFNHLYENRDGELFKMRQKLYDGTLPIYFAPLLDLAADELAQAKENFRVSKAEERGARKAA